MQQNKKKMRKLIGNEMKRSKNGITMEGTNKIRCNRQYIDTFTHLFYSLVLLFFAWLQFSSFFFLLLEIVL